MCLHWLGSCDYRAGNVQNQLVQLSWLQRRQWMLLRGSASVLLQQDGGRPGGRLGWQGRSQAWTNKRNSRFTFADRRRHTNGLCAMSVFRGRFSYRGFCLTLMAFRINEETLAGEIFQLVCAYKDGNQQHWPDCGRLVPGPLPTNSGRLVLKWKERAV